MMKPVSIFIRLIFCGILMMLLLFCNTKPTVQRGPEQDSVSKPVNMNADTVNRPDSTINKPLDDSTGRH